MSRWPDHIAAHTTHARRGSVKNAFTYSMDYVLIDPAAIRGPMLFSRNGFNLTSVLDRNHGGKRGSGRGVSWAEDMLDRAGAPFDRGRILLLTQPTLLGKVFNPVSFWLAYQGDSLTAVIAEVNNTFGERHSYLCHLPEFAPIGPSDTLTASKLFHVSPFQEVNGRYSFRFDIREDRIAIRIDHENNGKGVIATLSGPRRPLTNRALIWGALRRPTGAVRTIALIYWQALRLKLKGAPFRRRPAPPQQEIS
ncbi:DUF1365 domain-containing protein [uncultured Shimia sp.]|uniref:DUF1365 domain-containing protein n=1 Tax=uncultured Shimia sp. TaxID=573152 RepID=UPI002639B8C4|nr:DUF1365 domain-containing protein [uncultured Shimia sp.]